MAPRKPLAKKPDSRHELEEFAEKYETLAAIYQDPVMVVFDVMANSADEDTRVRCAEILMAYRFPKLKTLENAPPNAPTMTFNIQMSAPPAPVLPPPEIDITPAAESARLFGKAG
jgi:hypothetical protein